MMDVHERMWERLADYLDGLLGEEEKRGVEAHLQDCEECRRALDNLKRMRAKLQKVRTPTLTPEAKLRLYERINKERAQRGDPLLRIPEALKAEVAARARIAAKSAQDIAQESAAAAVQVAAAGVETAATAGKGMLHTGKKGKDVVSSAADSAKAVAREMGKTAVDVGRITTVESADVMRSAFKGPFRAMIAPVRLSLKGVKAGGRMMTGGAKTMAVGMKGATTVMRKSVEAAATGMKESAKTGKTAAESARKVGKAGKDVMKSVLKGMANIVQGEDEEEE